MKMVCERWGSAWLVECIAGTNKNGEWSETGETAARGGLVGSFEYHV